MSDRSEDEQGIVQACLRELRDIQSHIRGTLTQKIEFFDFGLIETFDSKKPIEDRLDELMRACVWHAIAFKTEFRFKLLYSIDGYLSAVEAKNPISMVLMARYLLELAATISAIDLQIQDCLNIDLGDWVKRGSMFLSILYRARHSTSDERHKAIFAKARIPESAVKPIPISTAIKRLSDRPNFKWAHSRYGRLSNMCHHNGSSHMLFVESGRATRAIVLPSGNKLFLKEEASAFTMRYPVSGLASETLGETAQVAWYSARASDEMILDVCECPFSSRDLRKLTGGRLSRARIADVSVGMQRDKAWGKTSKVGRNEPCPCGSGKKYKLCCGKKDVTARLG